MPRPKDAKVWNEELKQALRGREDVARRQGKRNAQLWNQGWRTIEAVRADIYTFRNGRIVNLPTAHLKATVDRTCRAIIAGTEPVLPPGYIPHQPGAPIVGNPYQNDPYLNSIKKRGGAFAILMAFYVSPANQVLTKQQICETGQAFCDTQMEENFLAGRSRGAWASIKTLESHGLVAGQRSAVGYSERAGGLRSHGPSTYTLTRNGQLFTQALLVKNPEVQRQIRAVRGGSNTTGFSFATQQHYQATATTNVSGRAAAAWSNVDAFNLLSASPPQGSTSNDANGDDEQELRNWLELALPGHQKVFILGNDDRQNRLHDLCDELNDGILRDTGMQLQHTSDGAGRSRKLLVTLQASHYAHTPGYIIDDDSCIDDSFAQVASWDGPQMLKSNSPPRSLAGRRLAAESPAKRRLMMTTQMVPAQIAAANAALERQAKHQESLRRDAVATATSPPKPTTLATQRPSKVTPPSFKTRMPLMGDNDAISFDDDDRKMPAKIPNTKPLAAKKPPVVLELGSDNNDDDIPSVFDRKPSAKRVHVSMDAITPSSLQSLNDVVDLTESQKSQVIVPVVEGGYDPKQLVPMPAATLAICIDDRERNRNHTPRMLRLELTRLLSTGLLSMAWPKDLPKATVEERRLESGDFSFLLVPARPSDRETALPLVIERKRMGDLVQRSRRKDHWYQLQRMQDEAATVARQDGGGVCVLLLEGDPRATVQYTPYGAQDVETASNPFDHAIDDEDSLYRFLGRAILNGKCIAVKASFALRACLCT